VSAKLAVGKPDLIETYMAVHGREKTLHWREANASRERMGEAAIAE
jgi:hypothetical protein